MAMHQRARPHNAPNPFTGRRLPANSPYRRDNSHGHGNSRGGPAVSGMAKKALLIFLSFGAFFYIVSSGVEDDGVVASSDANAGKYRSKASENGGIQKDPIEYKLPPLSRGGESDFGVSGGGRYADGANDEDRYRVGVGGVGGGGFGDIVGRKTHDSNDGNAYGNGGGGVGESNDFGGEGGGGGKESRDASFYRAQGGSNVGASGSGDGFLGGSSFRDSVGNSDGALLDEQSRYRDFRGSDMSGDGGEGGGMGISGDGGASPSHDETKGGSNDDASLRGRNSEDNFSDRNSGGGFGGSLRGSRSGTGSLARMSDDGHSFGRGVGVGLDGTNFGEEGGRSKSAAAAYSPDQSPDQSPDGGAGSGDYNLNRNADPDAYDRDTFAEKVGGGSAGKSMEDALQNMLDNRDAVVKQQQFTRLENGMGTGSDDGQYPGAGKFNGEGASLDNSNDVSGGVSLYKHQDQMAIPVGSKAGGVGEGAIEGSVIGNSGHSEVRGDGVKFGQKRSYADESGIVEESKKDDDDDDDDDDDATKGSGDAKKYLRSGGSPSKKRDETSEFSAAVKKGDFTEDLNDPTKKDFGYDRASNEKVNEYAKKDDMTKDPGEGNQDNLASVKKGGTTEDSSNFSKLVDGAAARSGRTMQIATWNIAAINNNPFEYWISLPEFPSYEKIMASIESFIEDPGANDVPVSEVFTEEMFTALEKRMDAVGWDSVRGYWDDDFKNRKIVSQFMKDKLLGSKRLASMPDRITNTINWMSATGEPISIFRPTVINQYEGDLSSLNLWWSAWETFMFDTHPRPRIPNKEGGHTKMQVYEMLQPIRKSKYPDITEKEAKVSLPLQTMCGAIFDAILVHMMNTVSSPDEWQPLKRTVVENLNRKKVPRTLEIIETVYGESDVIALQEVSASLISRAGMLPLADEFWIVAPEDVDATRDQNSVILLNRESFPEGASREITSLVLKSFEAGGNVPIANGDILAVEAKDRNGIPFVIASFHGDTNGLATKPVLSALTKAISSDPLLAGHKLIFGLDANTYEHARPGKQQDVVDFGRHYASLGLTSCWGDAPQPSNYTTFNSRTYLQPQLNKACRQLDKGANGDVNPKDFILVGKGDFAVKKTWKDNTGEKRYVEGMAFPTLKFPSDHGILATVVEPIVVSEDKGDSDYASARVSIEKDDMMMDESNNTPKENEGSDREALSIHKFDEIGASIKKSDAAKDSTDVRSHTNKLGVGSGNESGLCADDPVFLHRGKPGFDCEFIAKNKPDKCYKDLDGGKLGVISCPKSCNMMEECLKLKVMHSIRGDLEGETSDSVVNGHKNVDKVVGTSEKKSATKESGAVKNDSNSNDINGAVQASAKKSAAEGSSDARKKYADSDDKVVIVPRIDELGKSVKKSELTKVSADAAKRQVDTGDHAVDATKDFIDFKENADAGDEPLAVDEIRVSVKKGDTTDDSAEASKKQVGTGDKVSDATKESIDTKENAHSDGEASSIHKNEDTAEPIEKSDSTKTLDPDNKASSINVDEAAEEDSSDVKNGLKSVNDASVVEHKSGDVGNKKESHYGDHAAGEVQRQAVSVKDSADQISAEGVEESAKDDNDASKSPSDLDENRASSDKVDREKPANSDQKQVVSEESDKKIDDDGAAAQKKSTIKKAKIKVPANSGDIKEKEIKTSPEKATRDAEDKKSGLLSKLRKKGKKKDYDVAESENESDEKKKSGKEAADVSGKEAADDSGKEAADDSGKEAADESGKEAAEDLGKAATDEKTKGIFLNKFRKKKNVEKDDAPAAADIEPEKSGADGAKKKGISHDVVPGEKKQYGADSEKDLTKGDAKVKAKKSNDRKENEYEEPNKKEDDDNSQTKKSNKVNENQSKEKQMEDTGSGKSDTEEKKSGLMGKLRKKKKKKEEEGAGKSVKGNEEKILNKGKGDNETKEVSSSYRPWNHKIQKN